MEGAHRSLQSSSTINRSVTFNAQTMNRIKISKHRRMISQLLLLSFAIWFTIELKCIVKLYLVKRERH